MASSLLRASAGARPFGLLRVAALRRLGPGFRESGDDLLVGPFRLLAATAFDRSQKNLEPIYHAQHGIDRIVSDGIAISQPVHQAFGRVSKAGHPRQPEEAAGALDGVHQAEKLVQHGARRRLVLELHQPHVHLLERFLSIGDEFAEEFVDPVHGI